MTQSESYHSIQNDYTHIHYFLGASNFQSIKQLPVNDRGSCCRKRFISSTEKTVQKSGKQSCPLSLDSGLVSITNTDCGCSDFGSVMVLRGGTNPSLHSNQPYLKLSKRDRSSTHLQGSTMCWEFGHLQLERDGLSIHWRQRVPHLGRVPLKQSKIFCECRTVKPEVRLCAGQRRC